MREFNIGSLNVSDPTSVAIVFSDGQPKLRRDLRTQPDLDAVGIPGSLPCDSTVSRPARHNKRTFYILYLVYNFPSPSIPCAPKDALRRPLAIRIGSAGKTRTYNPSVNSQPSLGPYGVRRGHEGQQNPPKRFCCLMRCPFSWAIRGQEGSIEIRRS